MKFALASFAFLLLASPASAAVIDFSSSAASSLDGVNQGTVELDGLNVAVDADPSGATLTQSTFGLGIDYYDANMYSGSPYEIEGSEVLNVSFLDGPQSLESIVITNPVEWFFVLEVGEYTIDGSNYTDFYSETLFNDYVVLDLGGVTTDAISFRSPNWTMYQASGFAVHSITTSPAAVSVPELDPGAARGAVAVLVGGALVLTERRRASRA